jgi:hypothetical protein
MNEATVNLTTSEIAQLLKSVGYSLNVYQRQAVEFGNPRSKAAATELLEIRSKLEAAAMGGN